MTEFRSLTGETPFIPDNLSVSQFILEDHQHPIRPKRPAGVPWLIADGSGTRYGLEDIQRRTLHFAGGLRSQFGLVENNVVLIFSSNHIDYPICIWGVHRIMGMVSPANPTLTAPELAHQCRQTSPALIIAHIDAYQTACAAAKESGVPLNRIIILEEQDNQNRPIPQGVFTVEALIEIGSKNPSAGADRKLKPGEGKEKIAFLSASSGTTGTPKVVAISHYAVLANCIQTAAHNKVHLDYAPWEDRRYRPGDSCLGVLPFYHIYGLEVVLHLVLFCGMSLVVVPKFGLVSFLDSIVKYKITHLMVVPPQVLLLTKEAVVKNYDLSCVRMVLCAGSALPEELKEPFYNLLPQVQFGQAYGQTESTGVVSIWPVNQKRGISGGELIPGTIVRLVKEDGTFAGYDEPGELQVKTPAAALGYYGDEKATRETFVGGWVRSGDLVTINKNHEVLFIERLKEIMKVRGFQVAPAELEGCLLDHPWIADAGIVAMPDNYSGEVPLAFIVPTQEATTKYNAAYIKSVVAGHVAKNKARYKRLGRVEIVDAVPKNPSGKLLRRLLRDKMNVLLAQEKYQQQQQEHLKARL